MDRKKRNPEPTPPADRQAADADRSWNPEEQNPRNVQGTPGARADKGDEPPAEGEQDEQPPAEAEGVAADENEQRILDDLAAVTAARDDLLNRLQHLAADYQNYQKRIHREMEQSREYANSDLLKALVPVLDDLDRALEHGRLTHPPTDPLLAGVELVRRKALDVLKRFGLEVIPAQGQPFNPNEHEAVMRQPTADAPPMTVIAEAERGYALKGRTLRPAKVVVAMPPEGEDNAGPNA